jgi:hypothetical protein
MNKTAVRPHKFQVPCAGCPLRRLPVFSQIRTEEVAFIQTFKNGELTMPAGAQVRREGASGEPRARLRLSRPLQRRR